MKQFAMSVLYPLIVLLLSGCTTLGMSDEEALERTDFGPVEVLRICVLLDEPSINKNLAVPLIESLSYNLANYNIHVEVPWYRSWDRPTGGGMPIIEALAAEALTPPCDRLLALVGRNFGDFLLGLLAVDELGSVDTVTHTRGYIAANRGTLNQVFVTPAATMIHEAYHLLGCQHDTSMTDCYERIKRLKAAAALNRQNGADFFPTYSRSGQLLVNRREVDVREAMALKVERAKRRY